MGWFAIIFLPSVLLFAQPL
ncbi:MAG: hypothetical protein ACI4V1_03615 [Eubacteriales bacterium]